jgi:hypothetical protein
MTFLDPNMECRSAMVLYFPRLGKELVLRQSSITLGTGISADVDLSYFCKIPNVEGIRLAFRVGPNGWTVRNEGAAFSVRMNDVILSNHEMPLRNKDKLLLGEWETVIVSQTYIAPGLDQNMTLFFESISMPNGHVGSSITYNAQKRTVTYEKWGISGGKNVGGPPEVLEVPPYCTTKAQLCALVQRMAPCWPLRVRVCRDVTPVEDMILYFDGDQEVRFDGLRSEAVYSKWNGRYWAEQGRDFMLHSGNRRSMQIHIHHRNPQWPYYHHELMEDFVLAEGRYRRSLEYHAGEVIWFDYMTSECIDTSPVKQLVVPESVTTRAELIEYVKNIWPEWF